MKLGTPLKIVPKLGRIKQRTSVENQDSGMAEIFGNLSYSLLPHNLVAVPMTTMGQRPIVTSISVPFSLQTSTDGRSPCIEEITINDRINVKV